MLARKRIYARLKSRILSGRIPPGERLTEEGLARTLGISRTPVREALHRLASECLVAPAGPRGFSVPEESRRDAEELAELQAVMEGHVLRVACGRLTGETLARAETLLVKAERALARRRPAETLEWVARFCQELHGLIADKHRLYRQVSTLRRYALRYCPACPSVESARRALQAHREILAALRLRDAELCERLMRGHLLRVCAEAFGPPGAG
ncbi:MAG: GntR family transcriptional regulator [Candidatus Methylomirabilota bacterium]